ncbi:Ubiquitin family [Apiospora sp. TS-2023a]
MTEATSSTPRSKDQQPEEPQAAPSGTLPPKLEGALEMEDLTLKPAAQESATESSAAAAAASSSDPTQQAPVGGAQETSPAAQSSSQNTAASATPAEGEETTTASSTTQSKGKAPAPVTPPKVDPLMIGPAPSEEATARGDSVCEILLISTAASSRHPFKITERYLAKRNVNVPGLTDDGRMDLLSITVYSLKELILREWRREWETAPREPASIRLIRMGKMLDDKATLRSYGFSLEAPNVVHMTVKPQEPAEEEGGAAKGAKEAGHDSNEVGCCCIVL